MNAIENPLAFPHLANEPGGNGMSLRDWFAGQALAGMSAGCEVLIQSIREIAEENGQSSKWAYAKLAYERADAMLAERAKGCPA